MRKGSTHHKQAGRILLASAAILIGGVGNFAGCNLATAAPGPSTTPPTKATATATPGKRASGYPRGRMPETARENFATQWGVDNLTIRLTESGALVRFSYRVTDAAKAAPLHDRASNPLLFDERSRAELQVPQMEKVGPLRQSTTPETGKSYWMMFSNKGGFVKVGDRVSVAIGPFRVDGLIVE